MSTERHSATKATPELRAKYDPDKSGGSPELTQRRNTRSLTLQVMIVIMILIMIVIMIIKF